MVYTAQSISAVQGGKLPIGGTIGETFRIFGRAPLLFLIFGFASQIPTIFNLLFGTVSTRFSATTIVVLVANLLILFLVQTAMTCVAVRLTDGQPAPLGEALNLGMRRYLPMLGLTLLILLAIYGGMILLVVPGIILAVMFAVAVPVCAMEGLGPVASLKRSAALTKHTRWRILGIYIVFFLPLILVSFLIAFTLIRNGNLVQGQWLQMAIQIVWVPIASIFSAAIYIALRRLKENAGVAYVFD